MSENDSVLVKMLQVLAKSPENALFNYNNQKQMLFDSIRERENYQKLVNDVTNSVLAKINIQLNTSDIEKKLKELHASIKAL